MLLHDELRFFRRELIDIRLHYGYQTLTAIKCAVRLLERANYGQELKAY